MTTRKLIANTTYAQPELRDQDGNLVAVGVAYQHNNALRLAACWNACAGVPVGLLHDGAYREMIQAQTALTAERDALRTHLLAVITGWTNGNDITGPMHAAIAHLGIQKPPVPRITSNSVCGHADQNCNFEAQAVGSRCTTCGITIPF